MAITRREALGTLAAAAAGGSAALLSARAEALAAGDPAKAAPVPAAPAAAAPRAPVPLPFDPKKLRGLSEKLLVSHWENNYGGALKNLGKVQDDLARTTKDTPGYLVAGLRERELSFHNSVVLHELYFANLGGPGKPGGAVEKALAAAFGSFARFDELFRATGLSLAGGSGWAILDYALHSGELRVAWAGNHTQTLAAGVPLLVMDLYEHAYHLDYGASAAKYVDAFMANVHWEEVERRHARALAAAKALRGA